MHDLEYLFNPRSIAVVGMSANPGKRGGIWSTVLKELGYTGKLYIVNPDYKQLKEFEAYPSLRDIPGDVDLAIVSIPAQAVPQVIEDCAAKGVKVAHLYTAGFRESGAEGARLEDEIARIAADGGVRILGPNCMGAYNPSAGLSWRPDFPRESGGLAFLSQSGFNSTVFLKQAEVRGIRFSKLVSYGNACDLEETDFLEYFASDPETRVIAAYVEGVKDGQRFFRVLREITKVKPVILLKAGRTEAGGKAAASHTGSIIARDTTWDSLFKQTGAIRVDSIEESIDTAVAFLHMPPPKARRAALIGFGGGQGVLGADYCFNAGLTIPSLSVKLMDELSRFTPKAGTSLVNPLDVSISWTPGDWGESIRIIGNSNEVDLLIIHMGMTFQHLVPGGREAVSETGAAILSAVREIDKPAAVVFYNAPELAGVAQEEQERIINAGIPFFPSLASAARAIGKLIQYQDYRNSLTTADSQLETAVK